ncbi:hypothetical protein Pcinc_037448 [Petrolisthes cinctipes]|uniref:Uncharacterized protein n=1 Tax=Petrolisthes cinctipes TaxID=88211 RepID=A0AAE1ENY6_PETCI|nr:hypothetical protein Pcinc_037448 [Petrolisthes cinctipes]
MSRGVTRGFYLMSTRDTRSLPACLYSPASLSPLLVSPALPPCFPCLLVFPCPPSLSACFPVSLGLFACLSLLSLSSVSFPALPVSLPVCLPAFPQFCLTFCLFLCLPFSSVSLSVSFPAFL